MIDCIAGYHLNPWTCGIAKFNTILSGHLELPVIGIRAHELDGYRRPLLSIKLSEFTPADATDLDLWGQAHAGQFELFLHAFDGSPIEQVTRIERIIVAPPDRASINPPSGYVPIDVEPLTIWEAKPGP